MGESNKDRIFIEMIKDLSNDLQLHVEFFCYDWVIRFTSKNSGNKAHIVGYDWELNTSTAQQIAKDKNACYELLISNGILAVEHKLFLSPQSQHYVSKDGSWATIMAYAKSHNYNIICKPNIGTGGNDVYKIFDAISLENYIHTLFVKYRAICLCPFYNIENEYRVIVLNDKVELIYRKQRPHIVGNGQSSFLSIISEAYEPSLWKNLDLDEVDFTNILPDGQKIELSWKHNLGQGATGILIDNPELIEKLTNLALKASIAININFASIDIIESNGELLVIEINSGVMMESFARQSEREYNLAKSIYKKALESLFL